MTGWLTDFRPEVRRALPRLIAFRLVSNAAFRYGFSFLPAIADGSGLSREAVGRALSARDLTALAGPMMGRFSDRTSTTRVMTLSSAAVVAALVVASIGPWGLIIGFVALGLGKLGYDLSMNAWVGEVVAYERRGRATGIVELSWAGSALLLLPVLGFAIDQIGWWSASIILAAIGGPVAFTIARLPHPAPNVAASAASSRLPRSVLTSIGAFALMSISSQFLIVGHGLWLADTYDFDATQIGFAIIGIGVVEAIGALGSSRFTDRLGKRNSMAVGMAVLSMALAAMAAVPSPVLIAGLTMLVTAFLGFEFAIVSAIPLLSELDPTARSQTMGLALGTSTLVRAACSLLGVWLYESFGIGWLAGSGAAAGFLTVLVLMTAVPEPS